MGKIICLLFCIFCSLITNAQKETDSTTVKELKEIIIRSWQHKDIGRMPDAANGFLYIGKKTEQLNIGETNANIAIKTGRQLFAKVPGVFVYDMDGSGNQLNISTRGLDPHRSWEYNIRQNGILLNSDMYGYPASHYSAPMESYEKIELIRGTGSLQYGAQFGGMINYVTRKPDSTKAFTLESVNTAGSFGLLSTYNAISGTSGRFSYYAYYHKRHSNGYRENSRSDAEAQFAHLHYQFSKKLGLAAAIGRSKYLHQLPGQLNDSMFAADPRMSTRSRNYFSPDIYVPSLTLIWNPSKNTSINIIASGVYGARNSVLFDAFANVADSIDMQTMQYKNRQVDIDNFHSNTLDIKLFHHYTVSGMRGKLATGITYMNNDLHRRQLGKGTTGTDYDLSVDAAGFGRDLNFRTSNIAVYAENAFQLNTRWTISPGLRFEQGKSRMRGIIKYYDPGALPNDIPHRFLLAGVSSQYQIDKNNNIYGGWSQAYRPTIFKDIIPVSVYERVNSDLKDARGYTAELGIRGKVLGRLQYDISAFSIRYKNRMGSMVLNDDNGQPYTYKTNIGDSRTNGLELFLQYKFPITQNLYAGLFSSSAWMEAIYTKGNVASGSTNVSVKGNRVESVPRWISRNGLEMLYKSFSSSLLYNYTAATFSDALNTVTPPSNGSKGFTPAYSVWDLNLSFRSNSIYSVRSGINNIFNRQYFTKRPAFYPGPGIWPSDGRNFYVTIGVRM